MSSGSMRQAVIGPYSNSKTLLDSIIPGVHLEFKVGAQNYRRPPVILGGHLLSPPIFLSLNHVVFFGL